MMDEVERLLESDGDRGKEKKGLVSRGRRDVGEFVRGEGV